MVLQTKIFANFKNLIPQIIDKMNRRLVGLVDHCKLILLSALCKEHVLLIGPTGVEKFPLADALFVLILLFILFIYI